MSSISNSNYIISHLSFFNNPINSPQVSGADSIATTQNTQYPYSPRSTYNKNKFAAFPEEDYKSERCNEIIYGGGINVTREFVMDINDEKESRGEGRIVSVKACGPTTPISAEFIYVGPREKRCGSVITTIESLRGSRIMEDAEMGFSRKAVDKQEESDRNQKSSEETAEEAWIKKVGLNTHYGMNADEGV